MVNSDQGEINIALVLKLCSLVGLKEEEAEEKKKNLYSSCNAQPKSCLSDTRSFIALQVRDSATQSLCH